MEVLLADMLAQDTQADGHCVNLWWQDKYQAFSPGRTLCNEIRLIGPCMTESQSASDPPPLQERAQEPAMSFKPFSC